MVWILSHKLVEANRSIVMNTTIDTIPGAPKARRGVVVLFLLFCTFATTCTLSAQSRIVWQSFNPGFASSNGDDISLISLIGQPFVGDVAGSGIELRSRFGGFGSTTTSASVAQDRIPFAFNLSQNYPNPFNPSTVIRFGIPEASHVSLRIFDIVGKEVSTLVNAELSAGNHRYTFVADHLSSGVYFYRIIAASRGSKGRLFTETKKFILVK